MFYLIYNKFIKRDSFFFFILIFLFGLRFIPLSPEEINLYTATLWKIGYHNGVLKRGLPNFLLSLFYSEIRLVNIFHFVLLTHVIFLFLFYFITKRVLFKVRANNIIKSIIILFLVCPATLQFYSYDFARTDYLLTTITISIILLIKHKLYFIIPLLTALAFLIHEGFVIFYFPIIIIIIILLSQIDQKKKKALILSNIMILLFLALFTIHYQSNVFDKINFINTLNIIQKKSDFKLSERAIELVYFSDFKDNFILLINYLRRPKFIFNTLLALLLFSPILLELKKILTTFLINEKKYNRYKKIVINLLLVQLIIFMLGVDYGRWLSFLVWSYLLLAYSIILNSGSGLVVILYNSVVFKNKIYYIFFVISYTYIGAISELFPLKFLNNYIDLLLK